MCPKTFYASNLPRQIFLQLLVTHQLSQTKARSYSKETVCWFYVYSMCFLWHYKLLFTRSKTKMFNFIDFVKKCWNFCVQIFWDFARFFDKSNTFACAPSVPAPLVESAIQVIRHEGNAICHLQFFKIFLQFSNRSLLVIFHLRHLHCCQFFNDSVFVSIGRKTMLF